jgi:hypothetical protein
MDKHPGFFYNLDILYGGLKIGDITKERMIFLPACGASSSR